MKVTNTSLAMIGLMLAGGAGTSGLMARSNDFTESSFVQKDAEGMADFRAAASIANGEAKTGDQSNDLDSQNFEASVLAKAGWLPGLQLGLQAGNENLSLDGAFEDKTQKLAANATYQKSVGPALLRFGYQIGQLTGDLEYEKNQQTNLQGGEDRSLETSFLQHQISAAVDVDAFSVGVGYQTGDRDEIADKSFSYVPSAVQLFAKVGLTEDIDVGASFTQYNFDDLQGTDKDQIRNYQSAQIAAGYRRQALFAQARLATKGSDDKDFENYSYLKGEAYLGYQVAPALELGALVNYQAESYDNKLGASSEKVEASGFGFGIEANYAI